MVWSLLTLFLLSLTYQGIQCIVNVIVSILFGIHFNVFARTVHIIWYNPHEAWYPSQEHSCSYPTCPMPSGCDISDDNVGHKTAQIPDSGYDSYIENNITLLAAVSRYPMVTRWHTWHSTRHIEILLNCTQSTDEVWTQNELLHTRQCVNNYESLFAR